ncbi:uncharacterized protein B0I36DRAFT_148717 [Microdochium trichocladiopsis]|uniref:Uncharacterized protein n=1 Tax=Microdochium trichocladiopsis TaxID=1682393 RepID=A0A9P9BLZ5_9PEZI|nr:uncharacterized protein B0I36DRAFT_148717 [Microdochium trichocladiopsis]KAH7025750.1 hypothetical protein B0I36DRAFT_148717 [Microdochium trichocladiopsis]
MSPIDHHMTEQLPAPGLDWTTLPHWRYPDCLILAFPFFGLILLARFVIAQRSGQEVHTKQYSDVVSEAVQQQRFWASEKSRGVSRTGPFMPANHSPRDSHSRSGHSLDSVQDARQALKAISVMVDIGEGAQPSPQTSAQTWTTQNRPRPPPPLTPPVLSRAHLDLSIHPSQAGSSGVVDFDKDFFGLPNPDYMSATMDSTSATTSFHPQQGSFVTPRRRSYTKVLPFAPDQSAAEEESRSLVATQRTMSEPYPSSHTTAESREMNVQGEIISVLDDTGAGWKRHTRVYGGGVCLACLEAEGSEGGGFYGANVRPEDRRH